MKYLELDSVKSIKYTITSDSISGTFENPQGFYDDIYVACWKEGIGSEEDAEILSSNEFECIELLPGYNYSLLLVTFKNEYYHQVLGNYTNSSINFNTSN